MKSRWLLNLALLLFLIALILLVRYVPGRHQAKVLPHLTQLAPTAVRSVTLARLNKPVIQLIRKGHHWQLVAPVQARADRFRLDALLHVATARVHDRFPVSYDDLGKYGLATPLATLTLDGQAIAFGGTEPLNNLRYVRYQGAVEAIPSFSFDPATIRVHDFFSTRLLEKSDQLAGLLFAHFELRYHKGLWSLTPPQPRLTSDAINAFVDQWRYTRALSVTRYHQEPVVGTITLLIRKTPTTAPKPLVIDVLSRQPELVLYRPDEGLEYHFPAQVGDQLLQLKAAP